MTERITDDLEKRVVERRKCGDDLPFTIYEMLRDARRERDFSRKLNGELSKMLRDCLDGMDKLDNELFPLRDRVREWQHRCMKAESNHRYWKAKYTREKWITNRALREVGNKLADYLLRALPDMESFGSKTDLERAEIKRWKELTGEPKE